MFGVTLMPLIVYLWNNWTNVKQRTQYRIQQIRNSQHLSKMIKFVKENVFKRSSGEEKKAEEVEEKEIDAEEQEEERNEELLATTEEDSLIEPEAITFASEEGIFHILSKKKLL